MKAIDIMGSIFEGLASASAAFDAVTNPSKTTKDSATYGDVVKAVSRGESDSFWKTRMLDRIPQDADPDKYAAAISICEDTSMDGFWKARALDRIFKK